jgi:chromate transporter
LNPPPQGTSALAAATRGALFASFLKMGLLGFGGVMPWARRVMVDERRWFSDQEFAELLGMCQVLPGPNVVNLSVIVGARAHGIAGALIALCALLFVPMALVLVIATYYASIAHDPLVRDAMAAGSAAAAGLILGTAVRLVRITRPALRGLCIGTAVFVAVAILQWPLLWVIAAAIPVSIVLEYRATGSR